MLFSSFFDRRFPFLCFVLPLPCTRSRGWFSDFSRPHLRGLGHSHPPWEPLPSSVHFCPLRPSSLHLTQLAGFCNTSSYSFDFFLTGVQILPWLGWLLLFLPGSRTPYSLLSTLPAPRLAHPRLSKWNLDPCLLCQTWLVCCIFPLGKSENP